MKKVFKYVLAFLIFPILTGCAQEKDNTEGDFMSSKDISNNYETKTYCVGRHLIDIPITLTPVINQDTIIDGVEIGFLGHFSKEEFRELLNRKVDEINKSLDREESILWEKRVEEVFIVATYRNNFGYESGDYFAFVMKADSRVFSLKYKYIKGKEKEYSQTLLDAAKKIKSLDVESEISTAGACIPGGIYQSEIGQTEYYELSFKDSINKSSTPILSVDISFGENIDEWSYNASMPVTKEKLVAGFEGKEFSKYEHNEYAADSYWVFIYWGGKLSSKDNYGVQIDLKFAREYQSPLNSPYNHVEAALMWEQITNSIRPLYRSLK
jgi:hypothetical protein